MSLINTEVNNKWSSRHGQQPQQEMIIKTEAVEDDKFDYDSLLASPKLKYENEANHSSCDRSSESDNFESISCPVKKEPEDLSPGPDEVCQAQGTENLALKEEEINIEEHKPVWELIKGSRSHVGMLKDELDRCESVQENESRSSERTREEQAKYSCAHCSYKTNNKYSFTQHYNNCKHSKHSEVYKCQECSFETRNKSYFTQHYKQKHLAEVYRCDECSYETNNKYNFIHHYNRKHSKHAEVFKCQECSFETKWKEAVSKHYKYKHSKDAEEFKCQECSFETKNKYYFTQHYKQKHSKVYNCQECSFETKWKEDVSKHYKYKHSKDAELLYKCQECSFKTKYKSNLTVHYIRKHAKDPEMYKCQECSYKTKCKRNLTRHSKLKHTKVVVGMC